MGHFEELPGVWPTAEYSDNAQYYLNSNPDVAKDPYFSARPLEHWERYGKNEGRSWEIPSAPQIESGGGGDGGGGGYTSAPVQERRPEPTAPSPVVLPSLALTDQTSVTSQLNKLQSLDSVTMQQAKQNALEKGAATGELHGSQQGGASQRAVSEALQPLASAEASRKTNEEVSNWTAEVKKEMDRYDKEYAGYLAKLGFASQERMNMVQANTSLSTSLMGNLTSLFNNPDLVVGETAMQNISQIFSTAMQNNNTILNMGFTYA